MIDQSFRVFDRGPGPHEVVRAQPEVTDLVFVLEPEAVEDMPEKFDTGQGIGVVDLVADGRQIGAAFHPLARDMVSRRARRRILEGARVRRDRREQAVGDGLGDGPARFAQQAENKDPGGRLAWGHPVDVAEAGVARVMINVDQHLAVGDVLAHGSQPFVAGRVGGDHRVKRPPRPGLFEDLVRIEKAQFRRHRILVPANDILAAVDQGQGQTELGADAVAVRSQMADDADALQGPDGVDDPADDLRRRLHSFGRSFSICSSRAITRSPSTMESSITNRRVGV